MDASPFGALSGELRNRIYYFFFTAQLAAQIHIDVREEARPRLKRNSNKTRSAVALTSACRQLRAETLAIFWSTASFRIIADTLTAYSSPDPNDAIPGVDPMNRAKHINDDRAETLYAWLHDSGIKPFAPNLLPMELDLGFWDPRAQLPQLQQYVLRSLESDTLALTRVLENNVGNAASCTLNFKVQLQPSTALGPIRVPNERKRALVAVTALCNRRQSDVEAAYRKGMLTSHGYGILTNDVASCRAVAELLVWYIVKEEKKKAGSDGEVDDGAEGNSGSPGTKGKRAGQ